jgi:hypothetical protein
MASAVRVASGRFENDQRAYDTAVARQQRQLQQILIGAGVPAQMIHWGHTGEMSLNALAAIINFVSGTRLQVEEVHPSDFGPKVRGR